MINQTSLYRKSSVLTGLLFMLMTLIGCETTQAPDQVTHAFWNAILNNDIEKAQNLATENSQILLSSPLPDYAQFSSAKTGTIVIDGSTASVETLLTHKDPNIKELTDRKSVV